MSEGRWKEGRRAWERLKGWHQDGPGHPDDGAQALEALSDIGVVRRLLDQAELVAVRTARGHGKSWAEIATRLGVSRQSAWERWRELDETPATPGAPSAEQSPSSGRGRREVSRRAVRRAARELVGELLPDPGTVVTVPDVVGLNWDDARNVLIGAGLAMVNPDLDAPPPTPLDLMRSVVVDQQPKAGELVAAGSPVQVWLDRGGGAGDREPRRPEPGPRPGRALPGEFADEAVG